MKNTVSLEVLDRSFKSLADVTGSIYLICDLHYSVLQVYGDQDKLFNLSRYTDTWEGQNLLRLLPEEFRDVLTTRLAKIDTQPNYNLNETITSKSDESSFITQIQVKKIFDDATVGDQLLLVTISQVTDRSISSNTLHSNNDLLNTNADLISVNDKLNIVNSELEKKNRQLIELNTDFENLINSSGSINLFLDKDLKIRNYTKSIKPIITLTESDIGQNLASFKLPCDELIQDIEQVLTTLESKNREVKIENKEEGDYRWYLQSINPYLTETNVLQGVVINYSDITMIKANDNLLSGLINSHPGIIYILNVEDMSNVYTSPITNDILGYSQQELRDMKGDLFGILMHPDELPALIARNEKLKNLEDNKVDVIEYRVRKKPVNGKQEIGYFISHDTPYERNEDGSVSKVMGIAMDISALKLSQSQMESTRKLIASLSKMSPSYGMLLDVKTRQITFETNSLLDHLGYKEKKSSGYESFETYLSKFSSPQNTKILIETIDTLINKKKNKNIKVTTEVSMNSGEPKWLEWTIRPYQWNETKNLIEMVMIYIVDITELKQKEISLKNINAELEEFTYVSSHDLQQPLNTIQSSLNVLNHELNDIDNPVVTKCLEMMTITSRSMKENIKTILEYSKVSAATSFTKVNLNTVISEVIKNIQSVIKDSNAQITIKSKLPTILGDPHLIGLLMQNLITNAIKFQKEGNQPIITLSSKKKNIYHIVEVNDNGIGISKEHQTRIFTLFQRLHKESTYEGSGIGLAHAAKIMRIHNGKIDVKSKEGEGTSFLCYFRS